MLRRSGLAHWRSEGRAGLHPGVILDVLFPSDAEAILTNAAGCGSAMHEYHPVLRGTP